jgi:hypothetical protein
VFPVSGSEVFETNGVIELSVASFGNGNVLVAYEENGGPGRIIVVDPGGDMVFEPWTFESHVIGQR